MHRHFSASYFGIMFWILRFGFSGSISTVQASTSVWAFGGSNIMHYEHWRSSTRFGI